ncbi:MAG: zf-HC2 domain-containing protein [Salinivirgaceae bacterium]
MNCNECQTKITSYPEEKPSPETLLSIQTHLKTCKDCRAFYTASVWVDAFVTEEKRIKVNPFMTHRVMAQIEKQTALSPNSGLVRLLNPQALLVAASIVLALFLGVSAGSFYQPGNLSEQVPEEFQYLNDAGMESLTYLINE